MLGRKPTGREAINQKCWEDFTTKFARPYGSDLRGGFTLEDLDTHVKLLIKLWRFRRTNFFDDILWQVEDKMNTMQGHSS